MQLDAFFAFARERQAMLERRMAGDPPPWTMDPVLSSFYFCNVFREDDKTTMWFREHVRGPLAKDPIKVVIATIAFRWFNYIPTGERLLPMLLEVGWDERWVKRALKGAGKIFTGAYIIMPRPGVAQPKLDGVCWCMKRMGDVRGLRCGSLERAHKHLMTFPGMGAFYAYEVITDLSHTSVLHGAVDINQWANAGPGCKRGLLHVFGPHKPAERLELMHMLLNLSRSPMHWIGQPWTMREVEHTLCEYDKYVRGKRGDRLKRRYTA